MNNAFDHEFNPGVFFDLTGVHFYDIFDDVKYVWNVLPEIQKYVMAKLKENSKKDGYRLENNIIIGKGTVIQEGAKIVGPVIIGENCIIGHDALIRENCLLGNNVHIGHAVEIKNSIFLNGSTAAHLNYIGDSVVGNNVNISGGSIVANLRLDKNPVQVKYNAEKIQTNLPKFGSIIGDGCNIGVNAVLNPGTILAKHCVVYPLTSVIGYNKENSVIK